jgi:hypothetical protein
MSGKLGNTVFSSNQYGPYSCEKKLPIDHKTDAQLDVRAGTSKISRAWAKLSNSQRSDWRNIANNYTFRKKGKTYLLTGFHLFMKLNRNLYEVNLPIMSDPPKETHIDIQAFSLFSVKMVNTPSGKDLLLYINPPIESNTKPRLRIRSFYC